MCGFELLSPLVYALYVERVPRSDIACMFWLKNRRPNKWRDAWQFEGAIGKYIISDRPMTAREWIKDRATVVDAEPVPIEDKSEGE